MIKHRMIIVDFIDEILQKDSVKQILDDYQAPTNGYIYERLFDIFVKYGVIFKNATHYTGNINNNELCKLASIKKYKSFQVISGNDSGVSDISLYDNDAEEWIFCTVKYGKFESIREYGIIDLIQVIEKNHYKKTIDNFDQNQTINVIKAISHALYK